MHERASASPTGTPLIHAAAILDFDILVGDCVCARYPPRVQLPMADDKLSALCIPEGGKRQG